MPVYQLDSSVTAYLAQDQPNLTLQPSAKDIPAILECDHLILALAPHMRQALTVMYRLVLLARKSLYHF
jgi:hypothetical protein